MTISYILLYYLSMLGHPLQFIRAEFIPHYPCAITRRFPDYYGLQYLDGGRMSLQFDDQSYLLHGTYAWCVFPGPEFVYAPAEPEGYWSHRYITFLGERIESYCLEGLLPFAPQAVSPNLHLAERMDRLRAVVNRPDRQGQWLATNLLEGILLDLAETRTTPTEYPCWLPDLLLQLDQLLTSPIDYARLADEYGVSEHTLRRQFKGAMDVPIHTYVLRKKMTLACDLLRNSTLPIKEIASRLGYHDLFFFHRQFRQFEGVPPRQYRNGTI